LFWKSLNSFLSSDRDVIDEKEDVTDGVTVTARHLVITQHQATIRDLDVGDVIVDDVTHHVFMTFAAVSAPDTIFKACSICCFYIN